MGSGLIPRTLAAIFAGLHQEEPTARCIASFYELHNERVRDLLAPSCAPKELAWQDGGSGGQPRPQSKTTARGLGTGFSYLSMAFKGWKSDVFSSERAFSLRQFRAALRSPGALPPPFWCLCGWRAAHRALSAVDSSAC